MLLEARYPCTISGLKEVRSPIVNFVESHIQISAAPPKKKKKKNVFCMKLQSHLAPKKLPLPC